LCVGYINDWEMNGKKKNWQPIYLQPVVWRTKISIIQLMSFCKHLNIEIKVHSLVQMVEALLYNQDSLNDMKFYLFFLFLFEHRGACGWINCQYHIIIICDEVILRLLGWSSYSSHKWIARNLLWRSVLKSDEWNIIFFFY
jgi:hypothetical protein